MPEPALYTVYPIRHLRDLLEHSRTAFAERTAFLTKPVRGKPYVPITYAQYAADVDALGTALMTTLEQGEGQAVAILGESQYEWYVSYLAIVNGAARVVPLDKELPEQELASLLLRAHVSSIVVGKSHVKKLQGALQSLSVEQREQLQLQHIILMEEGEDSGWEVEGLTGWNLPDLLDNGREAMRNGERRFLDYPLDPLQPKILLFTSGTTSRSKAVVHNHRALAANLMAMCQMVEIQETDIFFSILPLHHTYECTCGFLCPLYRGASIAQCEGLRYIQANLKEARATVLLAVPLIAETFYKRIYKTIDRKPAVRYTVKTLKQIARLLCSLGMDRRRVFFRKIIEQFGGALRLLIVGGARVRPEVLESMNTFGILSIQGYGLTECAPIIALNHDQNHRSYSAGTPMPGVEIRVIDPDESGIGEFIARGENIMLGYYEDPEATAEAIDEEGFFHTGDLGYIDAEGFLVLTGRKKNVIVTENGKNIYPEELEELFLLSPWVQECVVSGRPGSKGETQIAIEIFPDWDALQERYGRRLHAGEPEVEECFEKLIGEINHKLPPYKAIRQLRVRETEFEKNTSKKIRRTAQV